MRSRAVFTAALLNPIFPPPISMALLDHLFNRAAARSKPLPEPGESRPDSKPPTQAAVERKVLRLERRELLYAVIRESMARVGILSSTYKYKVLSLDSRGNEYLVMMDLPQDLASHLDQLATIEETVIASALQRHRITVVAVYWRIQDLGKATASVLRRPRADQGGDHMVSAEDSVPAGPSATKRFAPIRAEEMQAYKAGQRPVAPAPHDNFESTQPAETGFEETRLDDREESADRMPLSRTQYGDLI